jgi:hypothetical protein
MPKGGWWRWVGSLHAPSSTFRADGASTSASLADRNWRFMRKRAERVGHVEFQTETLPPAAGLSEPGGDAVVRVFAASDRLRLVRAWRRHHDGEIRGG